MPAYSYRKVLFSLLVLGWDVGCDCINSRLLPFYLLFNKKYQRASVSQKSSHDISMCAMSFLKKKNRQLIGNNFIFNALLHVMYMYIFQVYVSI